MSKTVIKQVVKYEWICPKCGHFNSNEVEAFNTCKKCKETIKDFEYMERD